MPRVTWFTKEAWKAERPGSRLRCHRYVTMQVRVWSKLEQHRPRAMLTVVERFPLPGTIGGSYNDATRHGTRPAPERLAMVGFMHENGPRGIWGESPNADQMLLIDELGNRAAISMLNESGGDQPAIPSAVQALIAARARGSRH